MNEFIIVFRETLEATLIVGIIYVFLLKQQIAGALTKLWMGVASSIIASLIVAYLILLGQQALGNNSLQALFEAIFMFITAGFIWYVIFWLSKHVSNRADLEGKAQDAISSSSWGIFFVVFFSIIREGFETVVFLIGSFSVTGSFSYIGFLSGMLLAILIGYLIVVQGKKIDIRPFFKYTTLLLVFLASGMIAYGTHEVESYLAKSNNLELIGIESKSEINRPWDILEPKKVLSEEDSKWLYTYNIKGKEKYTHLLHDSGRVGVFFKGFFGYNSNPNYVELIAWIISLILGLRMWRRFYPAS